MMLRAPSAILLASFTWGSVGCVEPGVDPSTVVGNPGSLTAAEPDDASARRVQVSIAATRVESCEGQLGEIVDDEGEPLVGPSDLARPMPIRLSLPADADARVCAVRLDLDGPVEVELEDLAGRSIQSSVEVAEISLVGARGLALDSAFVLELGFAGWTGGAVPDPSSEQLAQHLADGSGLYLDIDADGAISTRERAAGAVLTGLTHPDRLGVQPGVVLVGDEGQVGRVDLDGGSYRTVNDPFDTEVRFTSVASGPSTTIVVGSDAFKASIYSSIDLQSFEPVTVEAGSREAVVYGGGRFVSVGFGNEVLTSTDGTSWERVVVAPVDLSLYAADYADGRFVAVGETGGDGASVFSEDGVTWSEPVRTEAKLRSLASGAGVFVGVDQDGFVVRSTDGAESWTRVDVGREGEFLGRVRFVRDRFVVLDGERSLESVDGQSWSDEALGAELRDLVWTGETHVGVGLDGSVLRSVDRRSWTQVAEPGTGTWNAVRLGGR